MMILQNANSLTFPSAPALSTLKNALKATGFFGPACDQICSVRCKTPPEGLGFVHFTYSWNISSILSAGLHSSEDGSMGDGVYAARLDDPRGMTNALRFVKENFPWYELADRLHVPEKDLLERRDDIDLDEYVSAVAFSYRGVYWVSDPDMLGWDTEGYVLLPVEKIRPVHLTVCPSLDMV